MTPPYDSSDGSDSSNEETTVPETTTTTPLAEDPDPTESITSPDPPTETPEPEETPTETPAQTATDCSAIPQDCRITIPELTDATSVENSDEFIVSRGEQTLKISMDEIIEKLANDPRLFPTPLATSPGLIFASARTSISGGVLTTNASAGFSSISRTRAGIYVYTFSQEQDDANYVVVATRTHGHPYEGDCVVTEQSTTSFKMISSNDNSRTEDPSGLNIIVLRITESFTPSTENLDDGSEPEEPNSEPGLGRFIDIIEVQRQSATVFAHQYSDFDPDTQVCVVVTDRQIGNDNEFANLRAVPVFDLDTYNGVTGSQGGLWYRTTNSGGVRPEDVRHYIWVTPGGKVVTNSHVGVLRFRRPTQEF